MNDDYTGDVCVTNSVIFAPMSSEEIIAVIEANESGCEIQRKARENAGPTWEDLPRNVTKWNFDKYIYRVKVYPGEYRPYMNCEEFCQAAKEHGPYFYADKKAAWFLAISVEGYEFGLDNMAGSCTFNHMLDTYTWQDGTKCGVKNIHYPTI